MTGFDEEMSLSSAQKERKANSVINGEVGGTSSYVRTKASLPKRR